MTALNEGAASALDGGIWLSISDLGKRKNISRQSAKERVDRLVRKGLIETRSENGKRLVDLVAYDRAVSDTGDALREAGQETRRQASATIEIEARTPALRDAQTERARYEARLKGLELAERLGKLVPVEGAHGIESAQLRVAEKIVRAIDQTPTWAPDLVGLDEPAMRRALKEFARKLRATVAAALASLAEEGRQAEAAGGFDLELEGIDE